MDVFLKAVGKHPNYSKLEWYFHPQPQHPSLSQRTVRLRTWAPRTIIVLALSVSKLLGETNTCHLTRKCNKREIHGNPLKMAQHFRFGEFLCRLQYVVYPTGFNNDSGHFPLVGSRTPKVLTHSLQEIAKLTSARSTRRWVANGWVVNDTKPTAGTWNSTLGRGLHLFITSYFQV